MQPVYNLKCMSTSPRTWPSKFFHLARVWIPSWWPKS